MYNVLNGDTRGWDGKQNKNRTWERRVRASMAVTDTQTGWGGGGGREREREGGALQRESALFTVQVTAAFQNLVMN